MGMGNYFTHLNKGDGGTRLQQIHVYCIPKKKLNTKFTIPVKKFETYTDCGQAIYRLQISMITFFSESKGLF